MEELEQLFEVIAKGNATPQERERFLELLLLPGNEAQAKLLLSQLTEKVQADASIEGLSPERLALISESITGIDKNKIHYLPVFLKYAAAIIFIIAGASAYLWFNSQKKNPPGATSAVVVAKADVFAPATNRAILTLSGGREIILDSVLNGTLAQEGNVLIVKGSNGQITYSGKSEPASTAYNTLTVPRGSQVANIILADGSKVFLNAASSIKYPVSFTGNERRVEIEGEAYFEVAKDATKRFIVSSRGVQTEVLGTHFNINSYADEQTQTVTLLEGKVKVTKGEVLMTLNPGQQATSTDNDFIKKTAADLQQVMAWKNGRFLMGNQDMEITSFLRQVSRWYDVDIKYNGNISGTVGGVLSRQVNVSRVLELLETSGSALYKIEGKTIIISPFK